MTENKVNMSLDDIIKLNRKQNNQAARGNGQAGSSRGRRGNFQSRGGRGGGRGRGGGAIQRGGRFGGQNARRGGGAGTFSPRRGSQLNLARTPSRLSLQSAGLRPGRGQNIINLMVKKAVRRALATSNRPRLATRPGLIGRRGVPLGRGVLGRLGGRGGVLGARTGILNRVQGQSRVIRKIVPARQQVLVQSPPKVLQRRFQRIQSPERVIRQPVRVIRQQIARPRQQQQVIVRRVIRQQQAPQRQQPQRQQQVVIRKRIVQRQPRQIIEQAAPRVIRQQVFRRPVQVVQRPRVEYVQVEDRRPQGIQRRVSGGQGRFQNQRVLQVPRFNSYQTQRVVVRRGRQF